MIYLPDATPSTGIVAIIQRTDDVLLTRRIPHVRFADQPGLLADVLEEQPVTGTDYTLVGQPARPIGFKRRTGPLVERFRGEPEERRAASADILHAEAPTPVVQANNGNQETRIDGAHDPVGTPGKLGRTGGEDNADDAEQSDERRRDDAQRLDHERGTHDPVGGRIFEDARPGGAQAGVLLVLWIAAIGLIPVGLGLYLVPGGCTRRGIGALLYCLEWPAFRSAFFCLGVEVAIFDLDAAFTSGSYA